MEFSISPESIFPLSQGFFLGLSMIISFGPQNLFILRQGIQGQYLFATALLSTLVDLLLITVGVGGVGAVLSSHDIALHLVTFGGSLFLFWFGAKSLFSCRRIDYDDESVASSKPPLGLQATIFAALSFSLLNPAAYMDTIVMIGSRSVGFPLDQRLFFGIGAVLASLVWFFTLTYVSSRLSILFTQPLAWRILNLVSGVVMISIGTTMLLNLLAPLL